jgi:hypothetical protein
VDVIILIGGFPHANLLSLVTVKDIVVYY